MKRFRVFNVLALIFNLAIVGFVGYSYFYLLSDSYIAALKFFTVLSNLLVGLVALMNIPFNIRGIAKGKPLPLLMVRLKLIATTCVMVTFLTAAFVLSALNGGDIAAQFGNYDFTKVEFPMHLIVPVIACIGFIGFDHHGFNKRLSFKNNLLSVLPLVLYGAFYVVNYFAKFVLHKGTADWYGFAVDGNILIGIGLLAGCIVGAFVISFVLWLLNRLFLGKSKASKKQKEQEVTASSQEEAPQEEEKEEPLKVEEAPLSEEVIESEPEETEEEEIPYEEVEEEEEETEPAPKKKPQAKKEVKDPEPIKEEKKDQIKVYHLTKRKEDGMWAITFVGGQKAVKLFKTKKEAEAALEVLTKNQGATALIRNSKGAKAGKFASSIKASDNKDD